MQCGFSNNVKHKSEQQFKLYIITELQEMLDMVIISVTS